MHVRAASVFVALLALMCPGFASAKTLRLGWLERTDTRNGYPALTFTVASITIGRNVWSVRASVANRSRAAVAVITKTSPYLPFRFGLFTPGAYDRHGLPEKLTRDTSWLGAISYAPALPLVLRPGATWRGRFSGRGRLRRRRPISVTFGVFSSAELGDFSWTTAHAFTL
jgi:hypothetical protein